MKCSSVLFLMNRNLVNNDIWFIINIIRIKNKNIESSKGKAYL